MEKLGNAVGRIEFDFSKDNIILCHFLVRPMKSGFLENVKKIWRTDEQSERDILFANGLEEQDLEESRKLFDYVIKTAKPDIIITTGSTLKRMVDHCIHENKGKTKECDMNENNSALVIALPYSYFEIALYRNDFLCLADEKHKVNVLEKLSEKYKDFSYDDENISAFLSKEIKIAGINYYEFYRKMMESCINLLNCDNLKKLFKGFCESIDAVMGRNIEKIASENKRMVLEKNRQKKEDKI